MTPPFLSSSFLFKFLLNSSIFFIYKNCENIDFTYYALYMLTYLNLVHTVQFYDPPSIFVN